MKVCPKCGFKDSPFWKPLFWKLYWEYMNLEDFKNGYPLLELDIRRNRARQKCEVGNFYYDFQDEHYYYKLAGKTQKMIHRFPKGYESMANRKLFEKTPSEKGMPDPFQKRLGVASKQK